MSMLDRPLIVTTDGREVHTLVDEWGNLILHTITPHKTLRGICERAKAERNGTIAEMARSGKHFVKIAETPVENYFEARRQFGDPNKGDVKAWRRFFNDRDGQQFRVAEGRV